MIERNTLASWKHYRFRYN